MLLIAPYNQPDVALRCSRWPRRPVPTVSANRVRRNGRLIPGSSRTLRLQRGRTLTSRVVLVFSLLSSISVLGQPVFLTSDEFPLNAPGNALVLNDFDGDGTSDVAVTHTLTGMMSVSLGDSRSFRQPVLYDVGLSPLAILSGQLDGDQSPDLVVANSGSSTISVFLNQGDGTFAPEPAVPVGVTSLLQVGWPGSSNDSGKTSA